MSELQQDTICISVTSHYVDGQSDPAKDRYVFSYTITIENHGLVAAKLLSRRWIITDADGHQEEVQGDGVVGEQPHMQAGEGFRYTSGAILRTPVGSMYGSYAFVTDEGEKFEAPIAPFTLAVPGLLH